MHHVSRVLLLSYDRETVVTLFLMRSVLFLMSVKKSPHWKITDFMYIVENMVYFVIDGQDQAFSSQIATSAGRLLNHVSLSPPEHKEPFYLHSAKVYMASVCHQGLITLIITKKQNKTAQFCHHQADSGVFKVCMLDALRCVSILWCLGHFTIKRSVDLCCR